MTYSKTGTIEEQLMLGNNNKLPLPKLLQAYRQAIDFNIICSMTDEKGRIIYANRMFCEISKYRQDELLGQDHRLLNSGYHPGAFFKELWETVRSGKAWRNEIKNRAKDGSYYWVDTVILPIYGEDEIITHYFSLRMPITMKKNMEEKQSTHIDTLQEMLHIISHKVRKPVASCLGLMNMIDNDKSLSLEDLKKIVLHFKSSALELDVFVKELTTFVYEMEQKAHAKNR